jgi:hypothetical protein
MFNENEKFKYLLNQDDLNNQSFSSIKICHTNKSIFKYQICKLLSLTDNYFDLRVAFSFKDFFNYFTINKFIKVKAKFNMIK